MNEDTAWLRRIVRWAVNVVVVLALAWFLVYAFCAQVPVSGNSMQPVLSADDVVLVNRLVYDVGEPERLDIVVFEREDHKKEREAYHRPSRGNRTDKRRFHIHQR